MVSMTLDACVAPPRPPPPKPPPPPSSAALILRTTFRSTFSCAGASSGASKTTIAVTVVVRAISLEVTMKRMIRLTITTLVAAAGLAAQTSDWTEPFPPHKVIGNVYYVGSKGLASYLITTPQGHILINSSLENSVPLIQASI